VLHVASSDQHRGAETFLADLIPELEAWGVSQRVALLRTTTGARVSFSVPRTVLGGDGSLPGIRLDPRTIRALRAAAGWRPDVVFAHGGEAFKHAAVALAGTATPLVYRKIGSSPKRRVRGLRRLGYAALMRRAARVIAVSEAVARETATRFGVPQRRIVTVPNAVDGRRIRPGRPRADVRRDLAIAPEAPVVISLGALTWEKDPLAHVEVMARVARRRPGVIHLIVGDGVLRPAVEEAVRRSGAEDGTRMLGVRDDVGDLLAAADVLLLASRTEGMPASVIEAGMRGLPVAAFAVSGVPEVVVQGQTGILVAEGDLEGLARGLLELVDDPGRRREMGRAASVRCRDRFDIRAVAPAYAQLAKELTGGPS